MNSLVHRTLFYVNTYGSYKLSTKNRPFFGPPCICNYASDSETFTEANAVITPRTTSRHAQVLAPLQMAQPGPQWFWHTMTIHTEKYASSIRDMQHTAMWIESDRESEMFHIIIQWTLQTTRLWQSYKSSNYLDIKCKNSIPKWEAREFELWYWWFIDSWMDRYRRPAWSRVLFCL